MDDGVADSKVSGDDRSITSRTDEGYDNLYFREQLQDTTALWT